MFRSFSTWPTDRKPDAVLVFSGQTFGYLRPCGCSTDQKGGLERRANLIAMLKAKGWPVTAFDLGDVAAPRKIAAQDLLKYRTTLRSLREMGYAGVGLGEYDFNQQLFNLLSEFTYQPDGDRPKVLAANLVGIDDRKQIVPREKQFPLGDGKGSAVEAFTTAAAGAVTVGAVASIGPSVFEKIRKLDATFEFLGIGPGDQGRARRAAGRGERKGAALRREQGRSPEGGGGVPAILAHPLPVRRPRAAAVPRHRGTTARRSSSRSATRGSTSASSGRSRRPAAGTT